MDRERTRQDIRARIATLDSLIERATQKKDALCVSLEMFDDNLQKHFEDIFTALGDEPHPETQAASMSEAITKVLVEAGEPVHRRDVRDGVIRMGVHIGSKDALNAVSSYLSNGKNFRSLGQGFWDLVNPPQPEETLAELTAESKSLARNGTG